MHHNHASRFNLKDNYELLRMTVYVLCSCLAHLSDAVTVLLVELKLLDQLQSVSSPDILQGLSLPP